MAWWQIILILVGAVGVGLAAGYLVSRLVVRATGALKRVNNPAIRTTPSLSPVFEVSRKPLEQAADVTPSVPDLLAEIEHNRRIATAEWKGELAAFQTRVWDNRGDEVHSLPAELRTELAEAYSDMSLANSITWLSTEMSRRSPSLDDSYLKLRGNVADRLNKIKQMMVSAAREERPSSVTKT